jgi:hypothetical protein
MVRESQSSRVERAIELKKSGLLNEEPSGALRSKLNRNKESDDEVNCEQDCVGISSRRTH